MVIVIAAASKPTAIVLLKLVCRTDHSMTLIEAKKTVVLITGFTGVIMLRVMFVNFQKVTFRVALSNYSSLVLMPFQTARAVNIVEIHWFYEWQAILIVTCEETRTTEEFAAAIAGVYISNTWDSAAVNGVVAFCIFFRI
jgi:hypothetical protein